MRRNIILLLMMISMSAICAKADQIVFSFTATNVNLGSDAIGYFSWDTDATRIQLRPGLSEYLTGFISATIVSGDMAGQSYTFSQSGSTEIGNLAVGVQNWPGGDALVIWEITEEVGYFNRIGLSDPSASAFSNDALPTELDLSRFTGLANIYIGATPLTSYGYQITSLSLATVPEPSSILLILSGLMGLVFTIWRKKL